jgi:hypothetical protein
MDILRFHNVDPFQRAIFGATKMGDCGSITGDIGFILKEVGGSNSDFFAGWWFRKNGDLMVV